MTPCPSWPVAPVATESGRGDQLPLSVELQNQPYILLKLKKRKATRRKTCGLSCCQRCAGKLCPSNLDSRVAGYGFRPAGNILASRTICCHCSFGLNRGSAIKIPAARRPAALVADL